MAGGARRRRPADQRAVGELRNQNALPAAAREVPGDAGAAEPHARVPADKAVGRGDCRLRAIDGIDPKRPDRERLRARSVAAGHVKGASHERPASQRAAALQRFEFGAAAAPRVVGLCELALEAGEVDCAGQACTSK